MVGQPTIFAAQPTPARLSCHPNRFSFEEIPVKRKRILEQRTRYRPLRSNDRESLVTERRKNKYKKSKLSICMSSCQAGIVMPSWTNLVLQREILYGEVFPSPEGCGAKRRCWSVRENLAHLTFPLRLRSTRSPLQEGSLSSDRGRLKVDNAFA